jgi:sulfite exporter TauE/SafE/copper chaperone CopZ
MHCASCELLIESRLAKQAGISAVQADLAKQQVSFATETEVDLVGLNQLFSDIGYSFSRESAASHVTQTVNVTSAVQVVLITFAIIVAFLFAETLVNQQFGAIASSGGDVIKAFILGLIASVSTCAALTGGMILSLSEKWRIAFIDQPLAKRAVPHISFHTGRLVSFALLGLLLGALGAAAVISIELKSLFTILISLIMVVLGLQMLNVSWARRIKIAIPKGLSRKVTSARVTTLGAFIGGASTVLLPCSLTLYAFSLAITAGAAGVVVMLAFAIGSLPVLAAISFSSLMLQTKAFTNAKFNLIAGILVIFFALYSINNQLNTLGLVSLTDLFIR